MYIISTKEISHHQKVEYYLGCFYILSSVFHCTSSCSLLCMNVLLLGRVKRHSLTAKTRRIDTNKCSYAVSDP